ncbi:MAG: MYXO-CTERM sorting domain-containing protein [Myxococcota bacterium]
MLLLPLTRLALATCTPLVDDDLTDGRTDGDAWGGHFTSDGWESDGGSLVYDFPSSATNGRFEVVLTGLEEEGVSQVNLAEMFTSHDGSFSDSVADQFLVLKIAGDIYGGYDGRIKLQVGMEYGLSGTGELSEWTDMNDWHPADEHTLVVEWGDGYTSLEIDGRVGAEADYTPESGGAIPFLSLRLPNNGSYTYDPLLAGVTYSYAYVCAEVAGAPATIDAFDVAPRELALGDPFTLDWEVSGSVTDVIACGTNTTTGQSLCTASLGDASGSVAIDSADVGEGEWTTWLEATGGGVTVTSDPVELTVHEPGWVDEGDDGGGDDEDDGGGGGGGGGGDGEEEGGDDTGVYDDREPRGDREPRRGYTGDIPEADACGCATTDPATGLAVLAAALIARRRRYDGGAGGS